MTIRSYSAARHPLRRALPQARTFTLPISGEPMSDTKLFLLTFASGFLAFYGFLS